MLLIWVAHTLLSKKLGTQAKRAVYHGLYKTKILGNSRKYVEGKAVKIHGQNILLYSFVPAWSSRTHIQNYAFSICVQPLFAGETQWNLCLWHLQLHHNFLSTMTHFFVTTTLSLLTIDWGCWFSIRDHSSILHAQLSISHCKSIFSLVFRARFLANLHANSKINCVHGSNHPMVPFLCSYTKIASHSCQGQWVLGKAASETGPGKRKRLFLLYYRTKRWKQSSSAACSPL